MLISLHKEATTTPKIPAAIQASTEPAWMVVERYGISEQTVWKWRGRDSTEDRSHTPHRLKTTLTPAQAAVAVALRTTLLLLKIFELGYDADATEMAESRPEPPPLTIA